MNDISTGADTLAFYGGAVKALGNGKVGGYLVLFSGPSDPDVQHDYFTKSTNFFIESGDKRPILYRHGMHPMVKSQMLGKGTLTIDDEGVFLEGEIEDRFKYKKAIMALIERGDLGWSSGSMSHLVNKVANGKSFEVVDWPIGEASLTTRPVEGRTVALPLKELVEADIDFEVVTKSLNQEEYDQNFSLEGIPSIKSFCEAVAPNSLKDGSHRSESAANAAKEFITITKILGEAYDSYGSRLVKRTESRFLKQGREIDPSTVKQVESTLDDMGRVITAFQGIKESLSGIKKISDMSVSEQRAMNERARAEMMNFCRISGYTPEEIQNAGTTSTS